MNLSTPVNSSIPFKSVWSITSGKATFQYIITNGWQQRHASIEESVRWQFPHLDSFTVVRVK